MERPSARSSASETAISKVAASMRSTAVLPKSCATSTPLGRCPPRRPGGPVQAGHPEVGRRPLDLLQCGVDRRAPVEGGALAPALALLGHHPHEEQRAGPVHAGGGADVAAEGEVDPDQLHPDELHGDGAPTPSP